MASPISATKLVQILRDEGLEVHEYRDWRTHNRNHKGAWGPINGVMIHHTVTRGTSGSVQLCYEGYTGLPGPLCHGVIAKDGSVWLVGNGRANHAGLGDDEVLRAVIREDTTLPRKNENNTDGNARFYGFEAINLGDGEDPWPAKQLDAIERASAAICRHYGWSAESVIGHLAWQVGKIDPRGFSMESMRRRINERLKRKPNSEEDSMGISDQDVQRIANASAKATINYDGIKPPEPTKDNPAWQLENAFTSMWHDIRDIQHRLEIVAQALGSADESG